MRKILFTTKSCPNCPPAKALLVNFTDIEYLDAHENMDLVSEFGIRAVPTLVVEIFKRLCKRTKLSNKNHGCFKCK